MVRLVDISVKEELMFSSLLNSSLLHEPTGTLVMFAASVVMFSDHIMLSAMDSNIVISSIKEEQAKNLSGSPILCRSRAILLELRISLILLVTSSIELTIDDKVDIFLINSPVLFFLTASTVLSETNKYI